MSIIYLLFIDNYRVLQGLYFIFCFYTNFLWFNMASLKTIKKWAEILKCELAKEIDGNEVKKSKWKACINCEEILLGWKDFQSYG